MNKLCFRKVLIFSLALFISVSCVFSQQVDRDIAAVIDLYLANRQNEAHDLSLEKFEEYKGKNDKKDAGYMLLAYLAGIQDEKKYIVLSSEKDPVMWGLASMSFFVRTIAVDSAPDSFELATYLRNYKNAASVSKSELLARWTDSVDGWLGWCEDDFVTEKQLPALLGKMNKTPVAPAAVQPVAVKTDDVMAVSAVGPGGKSDIANLDVNVFIESRKAFAARPKPDDFEFDKAAVQSYLGSLTTPVQKKAEERRYYNIKDLKEYLLRIFERNPYTGTVKTKKNVYNGTVAMVNANSMIVRNGSGGSSKSVKVDWRDIDFMQMVAFLSYYAEQRLKVEVENVTMAERSRQAGEDFLRIAVLCDWYGKPDLAVKYLKKSLETYPNITPSAARIFIGE